VNDAVSSLEELRALARLQGVDPDEADLVAVREFLSVFLPAAGGLSQDLPPEAAIPAPFPRGSP
jgi:hypothetical protein